MVGLDNMAVDAYRTQVQAANILEQMTGIAPSKGRRFRIKNVVSLTIIGIFYYLSNQG